MTVYITEGSWDDLMKFIGKASEAANAIVTPTQADIKPGQHFINFRYGKDMPIFGEILDYKTLGSNEEE